MSRDELARVMTEAARDALDAGIDRLYAFMLRVCIQRKDTKELARQLVIVLRHDFGPLTRQVAREALDSGLSVKVDVSRPRGRPARPRAKEPTRVGLLDGDEIAWSVYHHIRPGKRGYSDARKWASEYYGISLDRLTELDRRLHLRLHAEKPV